MHRQRLSIVEQDTVTVGPFGTTEAANRFIHQARSLAAKWKKKLGIRQIPLTAELNGLTVSIRASGVTGIVPIGPYDVSILPKYTETAQTEPWSSVILKMLAHAETNRFLTIQEVSAARSNSISFIDLIAHSYTLNLERALELGVPRSYERSAGWQPTLRGRLLSEKLYPGILYTPHLIPCEYSVYTTNSLVTGLLKWAALEFATLVSDHAQINHLESLASLMPEVSPALPSLQYLDRLHLPAQYEHCLPAVNIALWLAHNKGGQPGEGDAVLPGILLDSAMVFEDFVIALLKQACSLNNWRYHRIALLLGRSTSGTKNIKTEPDGQILIDKQAIAVVDAKYKLWNGSPETPNVYQVMVGSRLIGCSQAALIYPLARKQSILSWELEGPGNPTHLHAIFVEPLALTGKNGFQSMVSQLSEDLKQMITA